MPACPSCAAAVPEDSRFCGSCGAPVEALAASDAPTRRQTTPRRPPGASGSDLDAGGGRFLPGAVLAGRYRVVGLLGRGGMGEVYRADNLKLGQPVALKFLSRRLEDDTDRLERFLGEVRTARQVSHPSVCRVYDIGEMEGQHFLSMEYVDGEDLASLLRRIGRLPRDKGVQIARQVAAGLAAVHEAGILHRDLKPANIMIDGRGRVRLTDFGLAALTGDVTGEEVRSGTPAYMAPEQLAGREVTARCDLYALGVVLYELFTGRSPFNARSAGELRRLQSETTPASPSSVLQGFDPALERVILRCLDADPARRPASALAVAAALPGGDPLAAALAAGETPSPELVAGAGDEGGLRALAAVGLLAAVAIGVALLIALSGRVHLLRQVPLDKPPAVLTDRAREIVRELGYDEPPADWNYSFGPDVAWLGRLGEDGWAPADWEKLRRERPAAVVYIYRQSPRLLERQNAGSVGAWADDPPMRVPGEVRVELDLAGRLVGLRAVPPERPEAPASALDWEPLFAAAGLDRERFATAEPAWTPPVHADLRAAWEGADPADPSSGLRVEAGARAGRPVWLRLIRPWDRPAETAATDPGLLDWLSQMVNTVWWLVVLVAAALVATRNVRLGRGDRRTAWRFALYLGAVRLLWFPGAHHLPSRAELELFTAHLAWSFYRVGLVMLFYLALEPYARRLWPRMLVSWVRLMDGRFRDPLVGRDILVAGAFGCLSALAIRLSDWVPVLMGRDGGGPDNSNWAWESLRGARGAVTAILGLHAHDVLFSLVGIMLFLVARLLLRRTWIAIAVVSILGALMMNPAAGDLWFRLLALSLVVTAFWLTLLRVGLLAVLLGFTINRLLLDLPLTFSLGSWYGLPTAMVLFVVGLVMIHGFRVSLAGRPLLRDELAESPAVAAD